MIPPSADIAITLELLPERMQLVETVLSAAGLGNLIGSTIGSARGWPSTRRAVVAERWTLTCAGGASVWFVLFAAVQGVS